jgi:hypothetical protein
VRGLGSLTRRAAPQYRHNPDSRTPSDGDQESDTLKVAISHYRINLRKREIQKPDAAFPLRSARRRKASHWGDGAVQNKCCENKQFQRFKTRRPLWLSSIRLNEKRLGSNRRLQYKVYTPRRMPSRIAAWYKSWNSEVYGNIRSTCPLRLQIRRNNRIETKESNT